MSLSRRKWLQLSAAAMPAAWAAERAWAWAPGAPSLAQAPAQAPLKTEFVDIRRNVGFFAGRGGSIGTLVSAGALVVVDTQFPDTAQICLDGLKTKAAGRQIDYVINTHHHGDHTGGNGVFKPAARKVVAHARVPELMKAAAARPPAAGQAPPPPPTLPDTTFADDFKADVGDEVVSAKYYGPAHTSGDVVVYFEKADVAHMGDLVFNRRHPFIDRPSGASIAGWIKLLDQVAKGYTANTTFLFGHAGEGWKVTGTRADLLVQRDYFTALLDFVRGELKAGKPRDAIVKTAVPLPGFPDHGPLNERVMGAAYDEASATE